MSSFDRREYVCHSRLKGLGKFRENEMADPILDGRSELISPCERIGPFSLSYYWTKLVSIWESWRRLIDLG